jgi:hypothetical protein
MNPAVARQGMSFKGLSAYLSHDPGRATTSERVDWTETRNMRTRDPEKAAKVMAWTALSADELKRQHAEKNPDSGYRPGGNKLKKPVYHFSLTWKDTERVSKPEMREMVHQSLKALGVDRHEAVIVAHRDKGHKHVHVMVNSVNPETGMKAKLGNDFQRLQAVAYAFEKNRGQIVAPARAAKYETDPKLRREGQEQLKERRAMEREGKIEKASVSRPEWERRQKDRPQQPEIAPARPAGDRSARIKHFAAAADQGKPETAARRDPALSARDDARAAFLAQRKDPEASQQPRRAEPPPRVLNAQQDRHLKERGDLAAKFNQQEDQAKKKIEEQYGASRRDYERRLGELKEREERGSWLSRRVDAKTGAADERAALEKGLKNIEMRSKEILDPVTKARAEAAGQLRARQASEKAELEKKYQPARRDKAPEPEPRRDEKPEKGPGYSR